MDGICLLCMEHRELRDSHLIPKAAYRLVRDKPELGGGSPVLFLPGEKSAAQTDKQIKNHMLCSECESKLSSQGETWMGRLWANWNDFPLLDQLTATGPIASGEAMDIYKCESISKETLAALRYFAISVFWRASVWDWGRQKNSYRNALGAKYEEQFRLFLLGSQSELNALTIVSVNKNPKMNGTIMFPYIQRGEGIWVHCFEILGIRFHTFVGQTPPDGIKAPFQAMGSDLVLITVDFVKQPEFFNMVRWAKESVPRGKFANYLKGER